MIVAEMIVVANAVLAWGGAMACLWAASQVSGWLRVALRTQSAMATFYSLSFWWLAFHVESGREWSETMRWFGLASWPVAWGAVPVALVVYLRTRSRSLVKQVNAAVEAAWPVLDDGTGR